MVEKTICLDLLGQEKTMTPSRNLCLNCIRKSPVKPAHPGPLEITHNGKCEDCGKVTIVFAVVPLDRGESNTTTGRLATVGVGGKI